MTKTNQESAPVISFRRRIVVDSIKVMLVVGTILNAINQGNDIIQGYDIKWLKVSLTYAVLYLVSTYASVKTALAVQLEV